MSDTLQNLIIIGMVGYGAYTVYKSIYPEQQQELIPEVPILNKEEPIEKQKMRIVVDIARIQEAMKKATTGNLQAGLSKELQNRINEYEKLTGERLVVGVEKRFTLPTPVINIPHNLPVAYM